MGTVTGSCWEEGEGVRVRTPGTSSVLGCKPAKAASSSSQRVHPGLESHAVKSHPPQSCQAFIF